MLLLRVSAYFHVQVDDAFNQLMNEISMITEEISSKSSHRAEISPPSPSSSLPPPLAAANFSILSAINLEKRSTDESDKLNLVKLGESEGDENVSGCKTENENENDADESDDLTSLNDLTSRKDDSIRDPVIDDLEVVVRGDSFTA